MMPDRMPPHASKGEKRLFFILQKLPDKYYVAYASTSDSGGPEFLIRGEDCGLVLIYVRNWYPKNFVTTKQDEIIIQEVDGSHVSYNPRRSVGEYTKNLMNAVQALPLGNRLTRTDHHHCKQFIFSIRYMTCFPNIDETRLNTLNDNFFSLILPPNQLITRDQLLELEKPENNGQILSQKLFKCLEKPQLFEPLDANQMDILRLAIHPEINLSPLPSFAPMRDQSSLMDCSPRILDNRRATIIHSLGSGHRFVYGVDGSGKTSLVIAKARLKAKKNPLSPILVLCFSLSLASYLKLVLKNHQNIFVTNFTNWAAANGISRSTTENNVAVASRFLAILASGFAPHSRYFESILIDEAHKFDILSLQCALAAINDPIDGDLAMFGEPHFAVEAMGGITPAKLRWSDYGFQIRGRLHFSRFGLDENVRNSREIMQLASAFLHDSKLQGRDKNSVESGRAAKKYPRHTGIRPVLIRVKHRSEELNMVIDSLKELLHGQWRGGSVAPLQPHDVAILYPFFDNKYVEYLNTLKGMLSEFVDVFWLDKKTTQPIQLTQKGVKLSSVDLATGMRFRAVFLIWADQLPRSYDEDVFKQDRKRMYEAVTRAEDYLLVSASGDSQFVDQIALRLAMG